MAPSPAGATALRNVSLDDKYELESGRGGAQRITLRGGVFFLSLRRFSSNYPCVPDRPCSIDDQRGLAF